MRAGGRIRTPGEAPIDEEKARAIIEYAYEHGVNYFDTAYRYHDGKSERFVGKVLSQYPRDSWHHPRVPDPLPRTAGQSVPCR